MKLINVQCKSGIRTEEIYTAKELPLLYYLIACKESKDRGVHYLEIPMTFDIETTSIYRRTAGGNIDPSFRPFAFMYHWQFCLKDRVVFGRTWEEFLDLLDRIRSGMNLDNNHRVVVWVHNLSFEAQFFMPFVKIIEGFWKEERQPLRIVIDGGIEFRDSLALSNMSLAKLCENEMVEHIKNDGEAYDYEKRRYPDSYMSELELSYCYNDVRGLAEAIDNYMKRDTLASIPMTSTGFIRRECRSAMNRNPKNREIFVSSQLSEKTYSLCKDAFRGGDTHGNAVYADVTLRDVYSFDIASSYPSTLELDDNYPIGRFTKISAKRFLSGRTRDKFAHILTLTMKNPRYVGSCGDPYISFSKCSRIRYEEDESGEIRKPILDNGRVQRFFGFISIPVTDIDYDIIMSEYEADRCWVSDVYAAGKGKLPKEFRDYIKERFRLKTELKGVEGLEYDYMKEKNKINALFGMAVTSIDFQNVRYDQETAEWIHETEPLREQLRKHYKSRNAFLPYQWGVFCTANARAKLRRMLNKVGRDVVYCDTDSIKFINAKHIAEFEEENRRLQKLAEDAGAYADDRKGNRHYMGVWEYEGMYWRFRHIGAKRYIVKNPMEPGFRTTIAGVRKDRGRKHFSVVGIERFKDGETIRNAGHLVAYYNDWGIHTCMIDGHRFTSASNVALIDDTYTLGVTDEYLSIMAEAKRNACAFEWS